jgi:probable F420-dependent oxidoreductase
MAALGCKVPNTGEMPADPGLAPLSRVAEAAGATSLWVADHIVITRRVDSRYPYAADGKIGWPPGLAWYEALTSCAWAAAATTVATVGTAVLVLPQRDPILVAKTAATIDALSGGRMVLGVGAGWYEEEFEVLGWEFSSRGRRLDESIEVMRRLWRGAPEPFDGEFFTLPAGLECIPRPAREEGIPILVGGMSRRALERAARLGDGWLALAHLDDADPAGLGVALERFRELRPAGGAPLRAVARIVGEIPVAEVGPAAELARELSELGFDEIVIDPPWPDADAVAHVLGDLCAAVA